MGVVEKSIHVWKESITNFHNFAGSFGNISPYISLLRVSRQDIVVAVEGEEGRQLHPARAKLEIGVAIETAGIGTKEGDTEKGKVESLLDGLAHIEECGSVVTTPVSSHRTGSGSGGTGKDERPLLRENLKERLISGLSF